MNVKEVFGAAVAVLALTGGAVVAAQPASAVAAPGQSRSQAGRVPEPPLAGVDIIGNCSKAGAGLLFVRLLCADTKRSECSTRMRTPTAAATLATRDELELKIKAGTLPYSFSVNSVNSATFRSCEDGADISVSRIEIWNKFIISGIHLKECTFTAGGTAAQMPSGNGEVSCTIQTREETTVGGKNLEDETVTTEPTFCEGCSQLNSDVYQFYGRWSLGIMTRYLHESWARFTGSKGDTIRVATSLDFGI